ncbi:hypothetical protein [Microbacterium sp. P04]|uniref:hypothetical protein n=1 Tax=Microbacterium sp. P04 TaxID=3366947 RepID=UPI003744CE72
MAFGQEDLERMIADGDLEEVSVDEKGARTLLRKAKAHHQTAATVAATDPEIAAAALHAGNRKALEAVLLVRGLRPAKHAGHGIPAEAARAMLGQQSAFRT